jgi:hypothetical protein
VEYQIYCKQKERRNSLDDKNKAYEEFENGSINIGIMPDYNAPIG